MNDFDRQDQIMARVNLFLLRCNLQQSQGAEHYINIIERIMDGIDLLSAEPAEVPHRDFYRVGDVS